MARLVLEHLPLVRRVSQVPWAIHHPRRFATAPDAHLFDGRDAAEQRDRRSSLGHQRRAQTVEWRRVDRRGINPPGRNRTPPCAENRCMRWVVRHPETTNGTIVTALDSGRIGRQRALRNRPKHRGVCGFAFLVCLDRSLESTDYPCQGPLIRIVLGAKGYSDSGFGEVARS